MFRKIKEPELDSPNDYWVSFTDLMSALVIILIFTIVFLMMQRGSVVIQQKRIMADLKADIDFYKNSNSTITSLDDSVTCESDSTESENIFSRNLAIKIEKYSGLVDERINTVHRVSKLIQTQGLTAKVSNDGQSIIIPTDQLSFKQGQYEIPKSKDVIIESIAEVLYFNLIPNQQHKIYESIEIIGHTDSSRADGLLFKNWGLSVHRAASFWEKIRKARPYGKELSSLTNWKGEALVSIAGFGATRPIVKDDTLPEEQKLNRRIEIRFGVKQFSDREMRVIRNPI